jgi:hypothetical protein
MIRRSLPHRLLAAFCAVWVAISIAAPDLVHECAMHPSTSSGQAGPVAPIQPAAHGGHGGSHAASHDAGTPEHAGSVCSCLGDCAAAAGVSLVAAPVALLEAPVVAVIDPGLPAHAYVPVARALRLPFANGPPSLPPSARVL